MRKSGRSRTNLLVKTKKLHEGHAVPKVSLGNQDHAADLMVVGSGAAAYAAVIPGKPGGAGTLGENQLFFPALHFPTERKNL